MKEQTTSLKESVAVSKISADAAEASADAAYTSAQVAAGVSVPTLVVEEFGLDDSGMKGWMNNINTRSAETNLDGAFQAPRIRIKLKNYGQTPAFLKEWSPNLTCEELPRTPVYENAAPIEKIVIEGGATQLLFWNRHSFSVEDSRAIANTEKILRVYGRIRYGDIFGTKSHYLRFCETLMNIDELGNLQWCGEEAPPEYRSN